MIANLFLHSKAFEYNQEDSEDEVAGKLKSLLNDMIDVVYRYKEENRFIVSLNLACDCKVFRNETVMDFAERHLDGDEKSLFYTILGNIAEDCEMPLDELLMRCEYHPEEKEVFSLLALNDSNLPVEKNKKQLVSVIQFDRYIVVYSKDSWLTLRRQILGNHPGEANEFMTEAKRYFPKICFSNNCVASLDKDDYLRMIPRKIVYYLVCLNDYFGIIRGRYSEKSDRNEILADFSGFCGLDEPASLEGNPSKKKQMTFTFIVEKEEIKVPCEPHLKVSQEDVNCRMQIEYSKFHPRIYFAFDVKKYDELIFVGSIGPHL